MGYNSSFQGGLVGAVGGYELACRTVSERVITVPRKKTERETISPNYRDRIATAQSRQKMHFISIALYQVLMHQRAFGIKKKMSFSNHQSSTAIKE